MGEIDWLDWVSIVEIPVFIALVTWIARLQAKLAHFRLELQTFKTEVAKDYVSAVHLKALEERVFRYLERIENRLEALVSHTPFNPTCGPVRRD